MKMPNVQLAVEIGLSMMYNIRRIPFHCGHFRSKHMATWVTKYILFVQDPVGQFGANLAVKTLGHGTCIGIGWPGLPCVIPCHCAASAATRALDASNQYTLPQ